MNLLDKILAHCHTVPFSGCWVWMNGCTKDGYPMMKLDGRMQYVHHLTHDAVKGRPRKGFERDHLCKIRCCVNPDHLEAVSPMVNALRGEWHRFCTRMPDKVVYDDPGYDPFALV